MGGILPAAIPPPRGHPLRAIHRITNASHGRCRFFQRAPGVSRCAAPVAIHGRSDSVLGVSDLPLVKRAGLDQSKQPRTAIEAEFVKRVARGHGIKAPLPFEYDLNCGQRTFFFD
jgi:hypothetical protein